MDHTGGVLQWAPSANPDVGWLIGIQFKNIRRVLILEELMDSKSLFLTGHGLE
jgi:hypothetical protein